MGLTVLCGALLALTRTFVGRRTVSGMRRNVGETVVAGALLSVAVLSGCGAARYTASEIDLNVTITRGVVQKTATEQTSGVYRFRLRCRPDGGVSVA